MPANTQWTCEIPLAGAQDVQPAASGEPRYKRSSGRKYVGWAGTGGRCRPSRKLVARTHGFRRSVIQGRTAVSICHLAEHRAVPADPRADRNRPPSSSRATSADRSNSRKAERAVFLPAWDGRQRANFPGLVKMRPGRRARARCGHEQDDRYVVQDSSRAPGLHLRRSLSPVRREKTAAALPLEWAVKDKYVGIALTKEKVARSGPL